ncbi:MAG: FixH family protein [Burkholderiales bacterium]|nr:FixH family protein [Burkholderiales bacterium]
MKPSSAKIPWYREPWPWIIMAPPAAAVVAGVITIWIAHASADGLVADDYYRQGLAINRVLAREENARRLGVAARGALEDGRRLSIILGGRMDHPQELVVRFAHVARAGKDRELRVGRVGERQYEAELAPLPQGRWRVSIEDAAGQWRVNGEWPGDGESFIATAR